MINAIGEVKYQDSEDDIIAARNAYDILLEGDESLVTNYSTLVAAEARYTELVNKKAKADELIALIEAVGDEVSYPDSKEAIQKVLDFYDDLDQETLGFVGQPTLSSMGEKIYTFNNLREAAMENAYWKIDAIGEVNINSGEVIKEAREACNALAEEDKSEVTNYEKLVAAEARYNELVGYKADAEAVDNLINAIGEVSYPGDKESIEAARAAYDALTNDEQRGFVKNLSILEDAETTYESLRNEAISDVEGLINSIGEVSYPNSKERIEEARTAYDALNEEDKSSVSNYSTLVASENAYNAAKEADVNSVEDLINNIGKLEYTDECKNKIESARAAYDALSEEQKALVDNYSILTHAEEVYDHVDAVVTKINAIGEVSIDSSEKINSARTAYNSLTEEEKELIPSHYETLVAKENAHSELVNKKKTATTLTIVFSSVGGVSLLAAIAFVLKKFVFIKKI